MSITRKAESKFKFLLIRIIVPVIIKSIFFFSSRKEKTLLIVRSDGIGDYILFRNYLYFLKSSEKYKHHKIYLLDNLISKDLAIHLDSELVEGFFWYSDGYFLKWNLIKLLFGLQRMRFETIVYSNYSRKFTLDWLINKINAKNKIGVDGDVINEPVELKHKANKYYSELISVDAGPLHEFERNKQILEIIAGEKCCFTKPFIEKDKLNITPNNSIVIFPGAGNTNKKWPPSNFNKLCLRIIEELKTNVILAGANDDVSLGLQISNGIRDERLSYQADLNIIELCELIGGANLLISGDTAAIHIAALLGIPGICIAKGDLYGRFIPYASDISDKIYCVFPGNFIADSQKYDQWSPFTINDVLPEDVFDTIAMVLTGLQPHKN
ncbi:MAG: hypothetical protein JWQ66_1083 [Mucilaginibacter sp.]|nr:hypothetical protein [Mucilaginibacter sp.]